MPRPLASVAAAPYGLQATLNMKTSLNFTRLYQQAVNHSLSLNVKIDSVAGYSKTEPCVKPVD